MSPATLLRSVILQNYKSFALCEVELAPLTFIVGANGSGKSNFLDALRFVADALRTSLEHAVRERGGIGAICRRAAGYPAEVGIRLDLELSNGQRGFYSLEISAHNAFHYEIRREQCSLSAPREGGYPVEFHRENGRVHGLRPEFKPEVPADRLFLVLASSFFQLAPLYDALAAMSFYNFNPDEMREIRAQDAGERLDRSGSNIASVLNHLEKNSPAKKKRIEQYLAGITEGLVEIATAHFGEQIALELVHSSSLPGTPLRFLAKNVSDGTLRALGVLSAVFQGLNGDVRSSVSLIGIEEPENALHPGAAELLRNALEEASQTTQVLVTSHSPDLLDDRSITPEMLIAVSSEGGESKIGPIDEAGRSILRDRLFTPGELLRLKQLEPAPIETRRALFAPSLSG